MKTLSQDLTNRNWNIDLKAILKNNFHLGIIVLQCHLLCSQLLAGYPDHHQGWHHHQEQHEASAVWSPTSSIISRETPTRSRPAIGLPDKELLIGQVAPLVFRADPRAVVLPPHSHNLLPHLCVGHRYHRHCYHYDCHLFLHNFKVVRCSWWWGLVNFLISRSTSHEQMWEWG